MDYFGYKLGDRVERNKENWVYGEQDCDKKGNPTIGTIIELKMSGLPYRIKWDTGNINVYSEDSIVLHTKCKNKETCYNKNSGACNKYDKNREIQACYREYESE